MLRSVHLVVAVLSMSACASAQLTAFRDPAYTNRRFGKLVVFALGMRLDARVKVEHAICEKVAPTPCGAGVEILPPTRLYTTADLEKILADWGIDGVLLVTLASDESRSTYVGSTTQSSTTATATTSGTANLYGDFGMWRSSTDVKATTETSSTAQYVDTRKALGYLGLYDRVSGSMAWGGELRVSGRGVIAVTDGQFIRAATNRIAEELRGRGLLK